MTIMGPQNSQRRKLETFVMNHCPQCAKLESDLRQAREEIAEQSRQLLDTGPLFRDAEDRATRAEAQAKQEARRLDYLECELLQEQVADREERNRPLSLFRRNQPITRAAIDAAIQGAAGKGEG